MIIDVAKCRAIQDAHEKVWGCVFANEFGGRKKIGSCTYLYHKYGMPTDYQEFYDKYTADCSGFNLYHRGRSHSEIMVLAKEFKDKVNDLVTPIEDFYLYLVKKILIDTLDGAEWERRLCNMMKEHGYKTKSAKENEDIDIGIDGWVYDEEDNLIFAYQVKPLSFFIGNHNPSLIRDRLHALEAVSYCDKEKDIPLYYFLYNRLTDEWYSEGDLLGFEIYDLIDDRGYAIHKFDKRIYRKNIK